VKTIGAIETNDGQSDRFASGSVQSDLGPVLACFSSDPDILWGVSLIGNDGLMDLAASSTASSPAVCGEPFLKGSQCVLPFFDRISWINHCKVSRRTRMPVRFEYFNTIENRYFAVAVRDLGQPQGGQIRCAWTVRDITEMKKTENVLKLTNRKLKLMNSVAWHEIQNKITAIRGYVELMKDIIVSENGRTFIRAEEDNLSQIHELLHCTSEYQKIGSQPFRWFGVKKTFCTAASLMEIEGLVLDLDVDGLEIFADSTLGRAFAHLLRYSAKTSCGHPEIRIYYEKNPAGLSLIYEDSGTCLPTQPPPGLFIEDLLKSEDFCMKFVHDILDFSGMSIVATNVSGQGSRFIIGIPDGHYRFPGN